MSGIVEEESREADVVAMQTGSDESAIPFPQLIGFVPPRWTPKDCTRPWQEKTRHARMKTEGVSNKEHPLGLLVCVCHPSTRPSSISNNIAPKSLPKIVMLERIETPWGTPVLRGWFHFSE